MPKLVIDGWEEEGKASHTNLLVKCPKCGRKLSRTDASRLCGKVVVFCPDPKCRFMEEYYE